jgi:hypothetical protein
MVALLCFLLTLLVSLPKSQIRAYRWCTHLSLQKDAPIPRAVQTAGRTLAMPVLGGLHHQYFRA